MNGLPTPTKTYQIAQDIVVPLPATFAEQRGGWLVAIKDALCGFALSPYTVSWSTNGTVDGSSDNVTTAADVVAANPGDPHTSIVLDRADGAQYCLSLESAASSSSLSILFSESGGFTGGTTTDRPTAPDEVEMNTLRQFTTPWVLMRAAVHVIHSTDGLVSYAIVHGRGMVQAIWILGRASDPVTGWDEPTIFGIGWFGTDISDVNTWRVFGSNDTLSGLYTGAASTNVRLVLSALGTWVDTVGWRWLTEAASWRPRADDQTLDDDPSAAVRRVLMLPFRVFGVAGKAGWHGDVIDLWRTVVGVPAGTIFRRSSTQSLVAFGGYVFPWPSAIPPRAVL